MKKNIVNNLFFRERGQSPVECKFANLIIFAAVVVVLLFLLLLLLLQVLDYVGHVKGEQIVGAVGHGAACFAVVDALHVGHDRNILWFDQSVYFKNRFFGGT